MRKLLSLAGLLAVAGIPYACSTETPAAPDDSILLSAKGPPLKIDICHYSEETDSYRIMQIPSKAEAPHRAHGDGQVGEVVPGSGGKFIFDENCVPVISGCQYTDLSPEKMVFDPDGGHHVFYYNPEPDACPCLARADVDWIDIEIDHHIFGKCRGVAYVGKWDGGPRDGTIWTPAGVIGVSQTKE